MENETSAVEAVVTPFQPEAYFNHGQQPRKLSTMASRAGNKSKMKKPVQTTLGKAAVTIDNPQLVDISNVQKPIDTSIFGLRQVLSLFDTATDEVRRYISYECDIIYECRMCRSMYRSLANFILHKRNYCRDSFSPMHNNSSNNTHDDLEIIQENEEKPPEIPVKTEVEKIPKKNLNAVLKRLCNKEISRDKEVSNTSSEKSANTIESKNKIVLEKINTNSAGVFQTFHGNSAGSDLMKAEVMEIHDIFASTEAVLGPDGKAILTQNMKKVIGSANPRNQNILCTICNLKFSTKKTLTHHMRYKHNEIRVIYVCPECKDTFANAWSVFRHLYKVHHKSTSQIRKIRDQVHANAIEMKRDSLPPKSPVKSASINSFDQENQWINDIESDNDLQMCGGCGKRFERKAALNSHSHLCMKRLAVCNILKKNKRLELEDNYKRKTNCISGAQKRKSKLLKKPRKYVSPTTEDSNLKQEDLDEVIADCDTSDASKVSNQNVPRAGFNLKNEDNLIDKNETKFQKTAIEEIILGTTPPNTILCCSDTDLNSEDNKQQFSFKDIENIVTTEVSEIDEHAPKIVASYNSNEPNHTEIETIEIDDCDIQTIDVEAGFNCDSECQKESSPNNTIQTINSNALYISSSKKPKLPNILKKFSTCNNRNIKCDNLPNNNNNNEIDVQDIKEYLNVKTEENNQDEFLQGDLNIESNKCNNLNSIKEGKSLNVIAEKPDEFTETTQKYCYEESGNEELNFFKCNNNIADDNHEQAPPWVPAELDAKQFSEDKQLFNLYDDNSNSLTNLESAECKIEKKSDDDTDPIFTCDITCPETGNSISTTDTKSKKRKGASDEEVDDLTLEIKSKKYISVEKLSCLPCNMAFTSKSFLIKHMSLHFNWFCFQCSKCLFMSYDRQTCINHVDIHKIQSNLLDNIVMPIPHWKTVNLCTNFKNLSEQVRSECEGVVNMIKKGSAQQKTKANLTETNKNDPMLRKMIMEVIFGSESQSKEGGGKIEPTENVRPVRNRTSIQKKRKDFVYDMKQIDMKAKKIGEAKVKPLKIIKGVDTHFKVVRGATNVTYKKKRKLME